MMNTPRYRNVWLANNGRIKVAARRSRSPEVRGETCQRRKVTEKSSAEKSDDVLLVAAVENEEGGVTPLQETEVQASESLEKSSCFFGVLHFSLGTSGWVKRCRLLACFGG
ncbi:hypothetical protein HanIR_Chr09g0422331 [Helianthus annuus]|nr:hypothetical protein HanIR_Chr09g0422331 [Helianthus annuus]